MEYLAPKSCHQHITINEDHSHELGCLQLLTAASSLTISFKNSGNTNEDKIHPCFTPLGQTCLVFMVLMFLHKP